MPAIAKIQEQSDQHKRQEIERKNKKIRFKYSSMLNRNRFCLLLTVISIMGCLLFETAIILTMAAISKQKHHILFISQFKTNHHKRQEIERKNKKIGLEDSYMLNKNRCRHQLTAVISIMRCLFFHLLSNLKNIKLLEIKSVEDEKLKLPGVKTMGTNAVKVETTECCHDSMPLESECSEDQMLNCSSKDCCESKSLFKHDSNVNIDFIFDKRLHRKLNSSRLPSENIIVNHLSTLTIPEEVQGIPWKYLNQENLRLSSFSKIELNSSLSAVALASKGFAYFGSGLLICCFCSVRIEVNKGMSEIDKEHNEMLEDCSMLGDGYCNNIRMEDMHPNATVADFSRLLSRNTPSDTSLSTAKSVTTSGEYYPAINKGGASASPSLYQPSDDRGSSTIVTNTTDLMESDSRTVSAQSEVQLSNDSALPESYGPSIIEAENDSSGQQVNLSSNADRADIRSEAAVSSMSHEQHNVQSNVENASSTNTNSENTNSDNVNSSDDKNGDGEANSYEKLGIITARPKRLDYAVLATRMNSFAQWPREHHMKPEDLARAGYFYTGYSDCARCFYCGGGLRNWEPEDDVWVEHARWFPKCAFLLQEVGKDFIDTVRELKKERDEISYSDVMKRMHGSNAATPLKCKEKLLERDPAVLAVVDSGYSQNDILHLALEMRKSGELLSSDKLYDAAKDRKLSKKKPKKTSSSDSVSVRKGGNEKRDKEAIETLRAENGELRQQTICKICMDTEVGVVFLPCGHLVSCTECSCALTACPLCRVGIKGIVRAYIS